MSQEDLSKLLSNQAQDFIKEHQEADVAKLSLKNPPLPNDLVLSDLVRQIAARQVLKNKIPSWYAHDQVLIPDPIALQQCSSEQTAVYKSNLVKGEFGLDLTGGLGVDSYFLSRRFNRLVYVEQNASRCTYAAHNFKVLGASNIEVHQGDAVDYLATLSQSPDWIYLDPARRKNHRKVFYLEDCEPNLISLLPALRATGGQIMIKLSPLLDIDYALKTIPGVKAVHILSVDNDCKELLISTGDETDAVMVYTVNFTSSAIQRFNFTWGQHRAQELKYQPIISGYLYEPNASILKSGGFNLLPEAYGVSKLAPNTHLFVSEELAQDFPGRKFKILWVTAFKKKEIKQHLLQPQANITTRNFPYSVAEIRKRTGIKEGGTLYLFACRDKDGRPQVIGCQRA